MTQIKELLSVVWNNIATIGLADLFDILIIAAFIFYIIDIIRRSNTMRVARGIVIVVMALWLSGVLKLTLTNFLLTKAVELGLIAIVILFQPELRRILEKVGSNRFSDLFSSDRRGSELGPIVTQTVLACKDMSESKTGALIIFEGDNQLSDPIRTGTVVDAKVSAELLKNIFFVKAPLHDGAVIVRNGRIAAAGCMLPMSGNTNLSKELGMRHRAGIGVSERSDATVVIVSEETGAISLAKEGMLKRHLSPETLEALLLQELTENTEDSSPSGRFRSIFRGKFNGKQKSE
ncbi:MAG: diadenylate cyclase CdaA [Oscillospiraceae bacterium]|nr:diadenylate cyclase CdaA [Oscillospiraceae bacterium]